MQLENELELVASQAGSPLERMTGSLQLIRAALGDLRAEVRRAGFKDRVAEIVFFKEVKPAFYALQVLELELFNLVSGKPAGGQEVLRSYYLSELLYVERFFKQQAFQYQYYRLGASELDGLYFVRGAELQSVLVPQVPEVDPVFSTPGDYLFSRFMALEMLRDHILSELEVLDGRAGLSFTRPGRRHAPLRWTGDTINAVELAYGIWLSDQLNGGESELADIIYWLSSSLDIDLSRYTRLFVKIKERKIISKTRFIDLMRDAVNRHAEKGIALKPQGGKKSNA